MEKSGPTPERHETVRGGKGRGNSALVLDFDGTLTIGEAPLRETLVRALGRVRAGGTRVILATGRCLEDIHRLAGMDLFDGVVAENGAMLAVGRTKKTTAPQGWGEVRASLLPHFGPGCEEVIISAPIERLEAAMKLVPRERAQIVLNKDRLMILPNGVDKGTGVAALLSWLRIPEKETTCVGDGENDLSMFDLAGVRVALANSVDALKKRADYVAKASDGQGTLEALEVLFPPTGASPADGGEAA